MAFHSPIKDLAQYKRDHAALRSTVPDIFSLDSLTVTSGRQSSGEVNHNVPRLLGEPC